MDRIQRKPLPPRHQSTEPSRHLTSSGSSPFRGHLEDTGICTPQTPDMGPSGGHDKVAATGAWPAPSTPVVKHGRQWRAGLFTSFPIVGLGALLLTVACTGAAILVLILSRGQPVSEWSGNTQPGVLLAYTSTAANALMGMAFAEAIVIHFWTEALGGIRMTSLHYNWAGGNSVIGAMKVIFHGKAVLISSACVLVTVSGILRGPLIQRASFVETRTSIHRGSTELQILPNITDGWGSAVSGRTGGGSLSFTQGFSKVVRGFQDRGPVEIPDTDCSNCTSNVQAFGFDVTCSTSKMNFNLTGTFDTTAPAFNGYNIFESAVSYIPHPNISSATLLNITVVRKATKDCVGQLNVQTCFSRPSTVLYKLLLDSGIVSFQDTSWRSDVVLEEFPLFNTGFGGSTIRPLQLVGSSLFDSTSHVMFAGGAGWPMQNNGLLANIYTGLDSVPGCEATFDDPMDDIINSYREIALRMSVQEAANRAQGGERISQNVEFVSELVRVQYGLSVKNLAVAIVVSLIGPVATLGPLWGWWRLGRTFSMSPLEFANAFKPAAGSHHPQAETVAAVLAMANGNATADELVKDIKRGGQGRPSDPNVQYGVVAGAESLVMAVTTSQGGGVRLPRSGERL